MERTPRSRRAVAPILVIALLAALALAPIAHAAPPETAGAWAHGLPTWLTSWIEPLLHLFPGSGPSAVYDRAGGMIDPDGTPGQASTTSAEPVSLYGREGSSIDPNGAPGQTTTTTAEPVSIYGQEGSSIDPNGAV